MAILLKLLIFFLLLACVETKHRNKQHLRRRRAKSSSSRRSRAHYGDYSDLLNWEGYRDDARLRYNPDSRRARIADDSDDDSIPYMVYRDDMRVQAYDRDRDGETGFCLTAHSSDPPDYEECDSDEPRQEWAFIAIMDPDYHDYYAIMSVYYHEVIYYDDDDEDIGMWPVEDIDWQDDDDIRFLVEDRDFFEPHYDSDYD